MAKKFHPQDAEREANEIAFRFQDSSDVMADMGRAYHVDFSNINIHTDSAADSKVKAAGKDALTKGNDLFFGKGILESGDPAGKGLLAHELAHTMQQGAAASDMAGGEAPVSEMAPMGAEQGGLLDWFKGLFKKKHTVQSMDDPTQEGFNGYRITTGSAEDAKRRFMSTSSRAIYQMTKNATPEQLRSDPMLRQMILDDYKTNMSARLQGFEGGTYDSMFSSIFREESAGELKTFNTLLSASMPENLISEISDMYDETDASADAIFAHINDRISNSPEMMEVLQAGAQGLENSSHFSGENEGNQSEMMMNNVMLRAITPHFAKRAAQAMASGNDVEKRKFLKLSAALQKGTNSGTSDNIRGFRGLLNRFRRR